MQGGGVSYAVACERRQRSRAENRRVDMCAFSGSVTIYSGGISFSIPPLHFLIFGAFLTFL